MTKRINLEIRKSGKRQLSTENLFFAFRDFLISRFNPLLSGFVY